MTKITWDRHGVRTVDGVPDDAIKVGDRVRTGVYVCNEWRPLSIGVLWKPRG